MVVHCDFLSLVDLVGRQEQSFFSYWEIGIKVVLSDTKSVIVLSCRYLLHFSGKLWCKKPKLVVEYRRNPK